MVKRHSKTIAHKGAPIKKEQTALDSAVIVVNDHISNSMFFPSTIDSLHGWIYPSFPRGRPQ